MRDAWRQALHLEPPQGWLNDPNGLCWLNGTWHVYFQYCPDSASGSGRKCWGHWQSPDLLTWTFRGTALSPDMPRDHSGVYSGCALVTENGVSLYYTGNVKLPGDYDYITAGREANVLLVKSPDGVQMGGKQLLLTNADYPADCSCHVRDPKVWRDTDGFHMVLGARSLRSRGRVLLYKSPDGERWEHEATVEKPEPFGYMWECPDYFELSRRGILSVSPQGLPHGDDQFQNVYQSGWFPVEGPLKDGILGDFTEWDYGFDFYAPQSFLAPDGRRLLLGWMGLPGAPYECATLAFGRQHCLTLPREVFWDGEGRLCQRPARELRRLCGLPSIRAEKAALPFRLTGEPKGRFSLALSDALSLSYDGGVFVMEFTNEILGCGRTVRRARLPKCRLIEVIADRSSVEVFLDGGAAVLSTRFFPAESEISLRAEGFDPIVQPMRPMDFIGL